MDTETDKVIPAPVRAILEKRGLSLAEIEQFLYADYDTGLHDPFLLTDMDKAVERIIVAGERQERVLVYGDYDIDGITSSTVLIEGLKFLNIEARCYIPDRFTDGYGLNASAIVRFADEGIGLIITVDCGITNIAEVELANELGLDVIITDHHAVPEIIPPAVAVLNPKRPADQYPFKELCGAGVAFKLVQALQRATGLPKSGQEKWLLDLVALGTVGDVMPLMDENRILVKYGLKVMRKTRRVGLSHLANIAHVDIRSIESSDLGFILGPRLNAAGRLRHADLARELLYCTDEGRARELAILLDNLNVERRAEQDRIFTLADEAARQFVDQPVLVLAGEGWSHGVVGIVASKLSEKWRKPAMVAEIMGETVKGSARSVPGFNIIEALRARPELLLRYGGHAAAAGFTFAMDNFEAVRESIAENYSKTYCEEDNIMRLVDLTLSDLADINWEIYNQLTLMEPFGEANPVPVFEIVNTNLVQGGRIGAKKNHLKAVFSDRSGRTISAIGFGMADQLADIEKAVGLTLVGELSKNVFQGTTSMQLRLSEVIIEQH